MAPSNYLPASCLLLLLFLPAVRLAVVQVAVHQIPHQIATTQPPPQPPQVLSSSQPPPPVGSEIPPTGSDAPACKTGANCGIHVFRVALSSRPEEVGDVVPVKARKKYGSNVFVPRGSQDSFVLKDLAENIPAYIDSRVKDRIHEKDFVIKPVERSDVIWVKENEPLPKNFEPMRKLPSEIHRPPQAPSQPRFPLVATVLLVVAGVLFGVVASAGVFLCLVYSRRPFIDRSSVVVHRRHEVSTDPMPHPALERIHYPRKLPSVTSTSSSSRLPRSASRRDRRAQTRDRSPERPLFTRKISL